MKKIIALAATFLFIVLILISPLLIKVKIDCKSQYGDCPSQTLDKISAFNGKNLFVARKGIKKVLKSDFLISDYSLQYKIPNSLRVEILVKKPVVAFNIQGSESKSLVDKDGVVLSVATETVLPMVTIEGNLPAVGQNVGPIDLFAVELTRGVYQMYQVGQSLIQNESLLVELPGQIRVIFPLEGDSETLLGSLRLIYSKLREDGNLAGYSQIDLRYKNPVLR